MAAAAAASTSGTQQSTERSLSQPFGAPDEAGNTRITDEVVLAVAEAVALVMDQQLLQRPLSHPDVPFEEVSALLQVQGILLDTM